MKPIMIIKEQIKLKAFPFSLDNSAKEWIYYLLLGTITTRADMKKLFMEKYFPRARLIRKDICAI